MATLFRTIKAGRSNDKSGHARVMRCVADKCNGMRPDGEKVSSRFPKYSISILAGMQPASRWPVNCCEMTP